MLEVVGLPERSETPPELAVLGVRPHIRPLLAALQPSPRRAPEILAESANGLTAVGWPACLAAVKAGAVETLAVPYDGRVAGYEWSAGTPAAAPGEPAGQKRVRKSRSGGMLIGKQPGRTRG